MIPDDMVEEVRSRADIVEIIGELVPLKKAGREYKANCPFHEERTPSFYVVPDKGFYKCFGCGKSGDVFSFVMERQGMDFVEAVKHVAARAGVEVREVKRGRDEEDPNRPLYEINGFARDWFRKQLDDPEVGAEARAYLDSRGISSEVAERFGLGWAPDEWRALREAASAHGLDEELMLEVGLLGTSERSPEPYDRFRGRVVFPIEGLSGPRRRVRRARPRGRVQGRPEVPELPREPDLPEGPEPLRPLVGAPRDPPRGEGARRRRLHGRGLAGRARLRARGRAARHGADPGAGPAPLQVLYPRAPPVRLRRGGPEGHVPGRRRSAGGGPAPGRRDPAPGRGPRHAGPPAGSRGALAQFVDDAVDVLDRKLQILDERDYFSSIERTRSAVDRLLPTIRAALDPALRDIYVDKVAKRTGVRRETLEAEIERASRRAARAPAERPEPEPRAPRRRLPKLGAERQLLLMMVRGSEWVERAGELISPEDFDDPQHRAIFQALLDDPELRSPPPSMDPVAAQRFEEILSDPEEVAHGIDVFTKSVNRMRVSALDRRIQDLQRRIEAASTDEEKLALTSEKAVLARELRELDPNFWTLRHARNERGPRPQPREPMTEQRRTDLKELQRMDLRIQEARKRIAEFDPRFEEVEEPALILEGELGTTKNRLQEMKLEERRLELSVEEKRTRREATRREARIGAQPARGSRGERRAGDGEARHPERRAGGPYPARPGPQDGGAGRGARGGVRRGYRAPRAQAQGAHGSADGGRSRSSRSSGPSRESFAKDLDAAELKIYDAIRSGGRDGRCRRAHGGRRLRSLLRHDPAPAPERDPTRGRPDPLRELRRDPRCGGPGATGRCSSAEGSAAGVGGVGGVRGRGCRRRERPRKPRRPPRSRSRPTRASRTKRIRKRSEPGRVEPGGGPPSASRSHLA